MQPIKFFKILLGPKIRYLDRYKYPEKIFFNLFILKFRGYLSGGLPKNHPMKKIDFFRSTSHVDFLKAYIKLSYLPNFQNFWTLPH
jgi:hypothetical protein